MTDDRALLEAAARAAGIQLHHWSKDGRFLCVAPDIDDDGAYWEPLEDDGDALRLAVKLDICWRRYGNILEVCIPDHGYRRLFDEFVGDDKAAATRRAIVRAAAAMAKT